MGKLLTSKIYSQTLSDLHALQLAGGSFQSRVQSNSVALLDVNTAASISMWFYASDVTTLQYLAGQMMLDASDRFGLYIQSGKVFGVVAGSGGGTSSASANITINTLYHVVVTYDEATAIINLYLNGVFVDDGLGCTAITIGTNKAMVIGDGTGNVTLSRVFAGKIDNFRFYSRALTPTEVAEHYVGIYSDNSNLLINWNFDIGIGRGVPDLSGNNIHGFFVNDSVVTWIDRLVDF